MAIVNVPPKRVEPVKVKFTWTPHVPHGAGTEEASVIVYPVNGQEYPFFEGQASKAQETAWKAEYTRWGSWEAEVGAALTFVASVVLPSGVTAHTYFWEFGDGATGEGSTVGHTFTVADEINVILTVTDSRGYEWQAHQYFTLVVPGQETYKGIIRPNTLRQNRKAQAGGLFRAVGEKAVSEDEARITKIVQEHIKLPTGDNALAVDVTTKTVHLFRVGTVETSGVSDSTQRTWQPYRTTTGETSTSVESTARFLTFIRKVAETSVSVDTENPTPKRIKPFSATLAFSSRIARLPQHTLTYLDFVVNMVPKFKQH